MREILIEIKVEDLIKLQLCAGAGISLALSQGKKFSLDFNFAVDKNSTNWKINFDSQHDQINLNLIEF